MNRAWKQFLAVLGLNLIFGLLAGVAFLTYILRGDAALAAVPAVMALPAILLQPWFILFFFLPGGPMFGWIPTSVVTVLAYRWLDRRGKLDRAKAFLLKLSPGRVWASVGAVLALGLVASYARYVDFPPVRTGIPDVVRVDLGDLRIERRESRYYSMRSFIDSEGLWRVRLTESNALALAQRLNLRPLDPGALPGGFLRMPPYWWSPQITGQTRILSTDDFPMDGRGRDGWHALATWSPDDQLLHMWIKDNF